MILCLDIGNSQIFGGVFDKEKLILRFRHDTNPNYTSDQFGTFLKSVLRENRLDSNKIQRIAICSVVPSIDYSLSAACKKYFNIDPFFLQAGIKTGLKIKCYNPPEVGADLIATAIGAIAAYPNKNIIVIDFGTATTLAAVSKQKEYLGTVILSGLKLNMLSLQNNAAKLFPVEILKPKNIIGRSTIESLQSGLYYGQLGSIREIIQNITKEAFANELPITISTGGFACLFKDENLFTKIHPNLVLEGLIETLEMN